MRQVTLSLTEQAATIYDTIARGKRSSYVSELIVHTWTTPKQRIISELNQAVEKARRDGLQVTYEIMEREQ